MCKSGPPKKNKKRKNKKPTNQIRASYKNDPKLNGSFKQ